MLGSYEKFKSNIYSLTKIDLNSYKENQMRRRIDSLITKNHILSYDSYVELLRADPEKFQQFVNFLTINVSEFYRDPVHWKISRHQYYPKPDPQVWEEFKNMERGVLDRQ